MLLPDRHGSSDKYRYGFQGQEKDDEIKGEGNSYAFTFRMHDPRVGRFFAVDPLTSQYPHYTPYSFSGNKVIAFTELEGLEEQDYKESMSENFDVYNILRNTFKRAFGLDFFDVPDPTDANTPEEAERYVASRKDALNRVEKATEVIKVANYTLASVPVVYFALPALIEGGVIVAGPKISTEFALIAESGSVFQGYLQSGQALTHTSSFLAATNFLGQVIHNDYKFDENINYAQPIIAMFVKNPLASNTGESLFNLNIVNGRFVASTNSVFSKDFVSTFTSNLIGGKISSFLKVDGLGYKPAENVLNFVTDTFSERVENKIGDLISQGIGAAQKAIDEKKSK